MNKNEIRQIFRIFHLSINDFVVLSGIVQQVKHE